MSGELNNFETIKSFYNRRMNLFGMKHQVGKPFSGYYSAKEFANNLKAPFEIPVIVISNLLNNAISCLRHTALLCINFLVFDFQEARKHGNQIINSLTDALYNCIRGMVDTVLSAIELITRSAATVIEGVAEVCSLHPSR